MRRLHESTSYWGKKKREMRRVGKERERKVDLTAAWHIGVIFRGYRAHPCWAGYLTRVLVQVKVMCDIEKHGSLQMDNVSGGVREACYLFFYSVREFHLILVQLDHMHACVCTVHAWEFECILRCVCVCACSFTYAPRTSSSTESRGKLCCSSASELLKQSSADKPCILSLRERARA